MEDLAPPTARVLLIELAAVDRFHRAICYPYLFGFAKRAGALIRWLRVGVRAARQFEMNETGVGLLEGEATEVLRVIGELGPTWVVLDKQPSTSLLETIRAAAPEARLALLGANDRGVEGIEILGGHASDWSRLLGIEAGEDADLPFHELCPDFGYEPINDDARKMQPLPFIVLGEECTHNKPLAKNPFYQGLDLSGCTQTGGCSFCTTSGGRKQVPFSYEKARDQLAALQRTLPARSQRLAIRMQGELPFRHVAQIGRACVELGLSDVDLLFDARSDSLVRRRSDLAAACQALRGTGICIHLALIGVESFSRTELLRFNKGVTPLQNLDAIRALLELERDHPSTFHFREHGGISLILFSPWTTVEDLALNLRIIQECGLESLSGKTLGGRMRLEPGLPITELARRDGLLVESTRDEAFQTAKRNLYGEELPWRFQDPRMEALCSVVLRLGDPGDLDAADPLTAEVKTLLEAGRARGMGAVDIALRLVDRVMLGPAAEDGAQPPPGEIDGSSAPASLARALISDLEARLRTEARSRFAAEEPVYDAPDDTAARLAALCEEGIKPVAKIELIPEEAALATIERHHLPNARLRFVGQGNLVELFFGGRLEDVKRAVEMTGVAMAAPSTQDYQEALLEIGRLLGYPKCCVEKWTLGESARMRESYAWMHLSRRLAAPGPVDAAMSPWSGLLTDQYVPCGLACEASLELLPRIREVAKRIFEPSSLERNDARMKNPRLVLLRGQCSAMELVPLSPVGERFRYRPGEIQWGGDDVELLAAARGDELVLEPESLLILRGGTQIADLGGRAFVWWHERALQEEFLSRVLAVRSLAAEADTQVARGGISHSKTEHQPSVEPGQTKSPSHPEGPRVDVDPDGSEVDALTPSPALHSFRQELEAALGRALLGSSDEQSITAWKIWVRSRDALALRLGEGEASAFLYVSDARDGGRSFFNVGPFAFTVPKDKPLDTSARKGTLDLFARLMRRALGENLSK